MRTPFLLPLASLPLAAHAAINWDIYEYGVVPSFKWSRGFPDDGTDPGGFHVNCRATGTFHAKMYKLKDLPEAPPVGLAPWHEAIEDFLRKREYAGTWDGVDHKELEREIVVMEWTDVPGPVREWIEERQRDVVVPEGEEEEATKKRQKEREEERWLFGVFEKPKGEGEKVYGTVKPKPTVMAAAGEGEHTQPAEQEQVRDIPDKDKIVVFPAGAIYENLPLWVSKGSKCERELNNLSKYRSQAIDHSVLAWPVDHTKPNRDLGKRDITFKIDAMAVTETEEGKRARLMWEKMHRTIKRNDRKMKREERLKAKKDMEEGRVRDEL